MPYTTPQKIINSFDAQEIAQLATPSRYPVIDALLLELTISAGDRSAYTALEIEAADAALLVINDAITSAENIADSYLKKHYTLPLAQSQIDASPLPGYCADIARYNLADNQVIEVITKRYDMAMRWLRDIANGSATIGTGEPAKAGGGAVVINGPDRVFGRNRMKF